MEALLSPDQFEALRRLDTCTASNAIETFEVRLRNEGFTNDTIRCLFPRLPAMLGYAVTAQIHCSGPPVEGHAYLDRTDWWHHVLSIPEPRVVVLQDLDAKPGRGALLGEVHAHILRALKCVGAITNGAVRDIPAVETLGFYFFAHHPAVSHGYAHIVKVGGAVEVGGLKVQPGDLLLGDRHGVLSIPLGIAGEVPAVAARMLEQEQRLIALCRSSDFTLEKLRVAVKERR